MSEILPKEIDYKEYTASMPRYKYVRINMSNNTGQTVSIPGPGSNASVEFMISSGDVFNLSKSYIEYALNCPANGANNYTWNFNDAFDLLGPQGTISFENSSGFKICDLQNAGKYSKHITKIKTPWQKYLSSDYLSPLYLTQPSLTAITFPTTAQATVIPNYLETEYCDSNATANSATTIYRRFPLGSLYGTIFGQDQDLTFGNRNMFIKMTTANGNQMFWYGTSATDPVAGENVITVNPSVTLCQLYLAVETNPIIIDSVRNKFDKGQMEFLVDYVIADRFTTSNGASSQNYNLRIEPGNGHRLKYIITSVFNPDETGNSSYDCDNTNGLKMTSYQTKLDNTLLQDMLIYCTTNGAGGIFGLDDWRTNKRFFNNGVISSSGMYQRNWMHIDCFDYSMENDYDKKYEGNIVAGIPLEREFNYGLSSTCLNATANLFIVWHVYQRTVLATNSGCMFI